MKLLRRRGRKQKSKSKPVVVDGMNVFLRLINGNTVPCILKDKEQTSVRSLKRRLVKEQCIPLNTLRLHYGGRCLHDTETLEDYGIQRDGVITVALRLPGGALPSIGLKFAGMDGGSKHDFVENAPPHRLLCRGFNLQGCCGNGECKAFEEQVWCPIGFSTTGSKIDAIQGGKFNMAQLIQGAKCPACNETLPPDSVLSCGFYKCRYSYEGYDNGNIFEGEKTVDYESGYEYHNGVEKGKKWAWLMISVRPL